MTRLDIDQPLDEQIVAYRDEADATVPKYVRDYYDGIQDEMSTIQERQNLGDRATRPFIENILRRCTDTLASRILFRTFLCDDDGVSEYLKTFTTKNKYDQHVIANTVRILVDGNNALSLSWKVDERGGGRVVVHQEPWWDGTEGMFVSVDDEGLTEWAVKEWLTRDKRRRRTVYLPDRVIRQISDGQENTAIEYTVAKPTVWQTLDGEDTMVANWTKRNGDPLGVPVVHFGNTVSSSSLYGRSHIEPLLGLQDALNGSLFDNVIAGAMSASPIYTATGVNSEDPLAVGPGAMWVTSSKDAAFGVLGGQKLEGTEGNYRMLRQAIAGQFPVPDHMVTGGDWPSGLALQKVDSPMTSQAKLLGDLEATGHVMLAHRATEIYNTFGDGGLNEDAMIRIEYEPAEQLDEGTLTEINQAKVQVYRDLASLPKVLMLKTNLVTEEEADAIIAERDAGFVELASMTEEVL